MTKYLEIKQFMLKDLTCMFNAMFRDLTAEIAFFIFSIIVNLCIMNIKLLTISH